MKKITFEELKKLNGQSIKDIFPIEEPTEEEKGIIYINDVAVFGCFKNKVSCTNDTFAFIHFYNKRNKVVSDLRVFNVNGECFILENSDRIYSQTSLRVMNQKNPKNKKVQN